MMYLTTACDEHVDNSDASRLLFTDESTQHIAQEEETSVPAFFRRPARQITYATSRRHRKASRTDVAEMFTRMLLGRHGKKLDSYKEIIQDNTTISRQAFTIQYENV